MQSIWTISVKGKKKIRKRNQGNADRTHTHKRNKNVVLNKSFPQCKCLVESISYLPPQKCLGDGFMKLTFWGVIYCLLINFMWDTGNSAFVITTLVL